jgi:hypothetical protein
MEVDPMSDTDQHNPFAQPVRVLRIIVAAMLGGILMFMAVTVSIRASGNAINKAAVAPPLITYIAVAVGVASLFIREIVASAVSSAGRQRIAYTAAQSGMKDDVTIQLIGIYTIRTIIRSALVEGPTLFIIVAYLMEGVTLSLLVAIALTGILAIQFPSQAQLADWIDAQQCRMAEERMR